METAEPRIKGNELILGNPEANRQDDLDTMRLEMAAKTLATSGDLGGLLASFTKRGELAQTAVDNTVQEVLKRRGLPSGAFQLRRDIWGKVVTIVDESVCPKDGTNPNCRMTEGGWRDPNPSTVRSRFIARRTKLQ